MTEKDAWKTNPFVESILGHIEKDLKFPVDLPSRGKFYTGFNPVEGVKVRALTFGDEIDLAASKDQPGFNPVDFLIARCMTGLKVEDLLGMDRLAILLKMREVSSGAEYKTVAKCAKCSQESEVTFKLNELPINHVPDDFTDPREITLPNLKKKVVIRLPRKSDLELMGEGSIIDNLWRFIESFEGVEDKISISTLIKDSRFPIKDVKFLLTSISGSEYGVQTNAEFACFNCKEMGSIDLELGADFFS